MTLRQRLLAARARLIAAGVDNNEAVLDTNLLARHVLGYSRAQMLLRQDDPPPDGFEDAFNALIERRARREPAAYIRGLQEFWSRDFEVTPEVLIPRPESELIVEELLALLPVDAPALPRRVADIGTGIGLHRGHGGRRAAARARGGHRYFPARARRGTQERDARRRLARESNSWNAPTLRAPPGRSISFCRTRRT